MRRWILLALIVLMPLRAWAGAQMTGHEFAIDSIAPHAESARAEAHFDAQSGVADLPCHGHADAQHSPGTDSTHANDVTSAPPGHACNTCQVCHSSALTHEAAPQSATQRPVVPPCAGDVHFATLPVAPGFKPPIS